MGVRPGERDEIRARACRRAPSADRAPQARSRRRPRAARAAVAALWSATLLAAAAPAGAISLGPQESIKLRGRLYSQYTIQTEDTQEYTVPEETPGDMKQWRNFMNPELDVDFNGLLGTRWLDDMSGRLALWGFYDGIYDFGPKRYSQVIRRYANGTAAFQSEGHSTSEALDGTAERRDPRDLYGRRIRVNEAYVNLAKGPMFVRIGRQAISWGEADTIGLLDANNPFDTLITPGVFMDLDEARIPLWTARATYELPDVSDVLSSTYLDAYLVPGYVDTTITPLGMGSASPYSPPPPQGLPSQQVFDKLPTEKMGNSRWGVKLATMVARDYNAALWFYKTFPTTPTTTLIGIDDRGRVTSRVNHNLTNVIGASLSWYSPTVGSVIRSEIELFNGEPGFLVYKGIGSVVASGFKTRGKFNKVNILRGELGMDRNIFIPILNPTNSFTWVTSVVFNANLDESDTHDYRAAGIVKPSAIERALNGGAPAGFYNGPSCDNRNIDPPPGQPRCDYVNQNAFQAFMQSNIQTDFLHGHIAPRLTFIADFRGAISFLPSVLYRQSDSLLFDLKYVTTHTFGSINNGYTAGIGLNRDRDQLWFRATYQLN